jgi:hypothetical protein
MMLKWVETNHSIKLELLWANQKEWKIYIPLIRLITPTVLNDKTGIMDSFTFKETAVKNYTVDHLIIWLYKASDK